MKLFNLFDFLPILGPYRLTYYRATVLRAPPTLLRLCTLVEVSVAVGIFAISYYYTATTSTTTTVVTFESKGSPYTCTVLSPRSDTATYNVQSSEMAAFSQARFDYTSCMSTLSDYAVCSNLHRQDYILSLGGLGTANSTCEDLLLGDNYKFCNGEEKETSFKTGALSLQFPTSPKAPVQTYSQQYFYMNSSSHVIEQGNLPTTGSILTDFVVGQNREVFVIQSSSNGLNSFLYQFDFSLSSPSQATSISSAAIYGVVYGNQVVYALEIKQQPGGGGSVTYQATIFSYSTVSKPQQADSHSFTCPGQAGASFSLPTVSSSNRYLSYGTDGKLYFFCYESGQPLFEFAQVDPSSWTMASFSANVTQVNYYNDKGVATNGKVNSVSQVFRLGQKMYFTSTKSFPNLLQGDLQTISPGNVINGITNLGYYQGSASKSYPAIMASSSVLYFPGSSNRSYYDTSSQSFKESYSQATDSSYYRATYVQIAFSYQLCNGNYSDYHVDYSSSSSFATRCGQINGVYYQKNAYYTIPQTCQGYITSTSQNQALFQCPGVASIKQTFIDNDCTSSFSQVCTSEYTDNPPFSCSTDTYPTFLTTIATAIANSSGAWSVMVIALQIILKFFYPHGTIDFDYDESVNRFLPLHDHKKNYWHHAKIKILPSHSHDEEEGRKGREVELQTAIPVHPINPPTNRAEYDHRHLGERSSDDVESATNLHHRK